MKKFFPTLLVLGVLAGSVLSFQGPVYAIPGSQGVCAFTFETITSADGAEPIPGLVLTVTNTATSNRKAIVQVSADTGGVIFS